MNEISPAESEMGASFAVTSVSKWIVFHKLSVNRQTSV
jgi:hypothetical protein